MSNERAEKFALENDLELDEVRNFFRGVDTNVEEDVE